MSLCVFFGMGLVITPLQTPRRFNPLAQPLEASQKLGGRDLVWRFVGGDITSDGGALVLKKLEERTRIVARFAACFTDYRKADQIEHPLLDLIAHECVSAADLGVCPRQAIEGNVGCPLIRIQAQPPPSRSTDAAML